MLQKIVDPLKLFIIGAIVAALIVIGFQLGKQTNEGLLTYLQQEKSKLAQKVEQLERENMLLLTEKAQAVEEAASKPGSLESQVPAIPTPTETTANAHEPVAEQPSDPTAINQISDTFSAPETPPQAQ